MAEKSISSMIEVESLADTDMLVVSVGGETKKVSVKTLKDSVGGGVVSIVYDITDDMWDIYYPNNFIESHIVNINPININASEVIG